MPLVNLTPHALSIHGEGGAVVEVPPSGTVARVATTREHGGSIVVDGVKIPVFSVRFGEVTGLPAPSTGEWTIYVVSGLVKASPEVNARPDVMCPGELVRDAAGQPVGCRGLVGRV